MGTGCVTNGMFVEPFKSPPKIPRIALVNDEGLYTDESGNVFCDNEEYKFRLGEIVAFILWDTAMLLTKQGHGEILRWNTKDIRWRATKYPEEETWKPRSLDAGIIQFPVGFNLNFDKVLTQLIEYRDWLVSEGAKPHCSSGSTSLSLLKAKLEDKLITGLGSCPPVGYTRGGRTLMGLEGKGRFEGQIIHWDLPAAYASTMGNIFYNGTWEVRPYNSAIKAHNHGAPVFCNAIVDVPNLPFGPLPESLRNSSNPLEGALLNRFGYTKDGRIEGIWTLNELFAAEEVGCKISPIQCWAMLSGKQPFLPWWKAILRGRELTGEISRSLAKRTGNALWGMFCTDGDARTKKIIVHYENGKTKIRRINFRRNGQKPGHDLAEAISSSVRAKLYQHIVAADKHLICGHTDGIWVKGKYDVPDGWRIKQIARRIDVLDPQTFRYFIDSKTSYVVMAGIPPKMAPEKFEKKWSAYERNKARGNTMPDLQSSRSNKRRVRRIPDPDHFPE